MVPQSGWGCVQTRSWCERRVVHNLALQGYEAFCPMYNRPANGRAEVEAPLFPCYVFVALESGQPWLSINGTYGAIRILTDRSGDVPRPLLVADEVIRASLALAVEPFVKIGRFPVFAPGAVVRVKNPDSPYYDRVGTVASMDGPARVAVVMAFFNRDTRVRFADACDLEAV